MSAVKKGIIGAVIGAIIIGGFMVAGMLETKGLPMALVGIPIGALYGFGVPFGWNSMKKMFSVGSGMDNFVLRFVLVIFAIALMWVFGIFKGIIEIVKEVIDK